MPTQYATPRNVLALEKKLKSDRLTKKETDLINAYIGTAWAKACRDAKGQNKRDALYHRYMNEHAHSLGLRTI